MFSIKCDECKREIGRTDSLAESAAGGLCPDCRHIAAVARLTGRGTYRERREARAARLRGWAEKRETAAAAVFEAGRPFTTDHAFNTQPGHIPFRAKLIAREDRAVESLRKADGMTCRAAGIEHQLATSIYSDDPDAIEQLEAKIARLEARRAEIKARPHQAYELSNLGATIRTARKRLEVLQRAV